MNVTATLNVLEGYFSHQAPVLTHFPPDLPTFFDPGNVKPPITFASATDPREAVLDLAKQESLTRLGRTCADPLGPRSVQVLLSSAEEAPFVRPIDESWSAVPTRLFNAISFFAWYAKSHQMDLKPRMLSLGSGDALTAVVAARYGFEVTAVDREPIAFAQAIVREHYRNAAQIGLSLSDRDEVIEIGQITIPEGLPIHYFRGVTKSDIETFKNSGEIYPILGDGFDTSTWKSLSMEEESHSKRLEPRIKLESNVPRKYSVVECTDVIATHEGSDSRVELDKEVVARFTEISIGFATKLKKLCEFVDDNGWLFVSFPTTDPTLNDSEITQHSLFVTACLSPQMVSRIAEGIFAMHSIRGVLCVDKPVFPNEGFSATLIGKKVGCR